MHKLKIAALTLGLLLAAGHANATPIVNTGVPDNTGFPMAVDNTDWYAGKFTVGAGQTRIDAIDWYLTMDPDLSQSTNFTISLYANSGTSAPNVHNPLYTATATYTADGWNGLSGLTWDVSAGTYWAAIESNGGFVGTLPTYAAALTASGQNTAYGDGFTYATQPSGLGFGLEVDAVPEPETYALMLAGLGLIGVAARRKSQRG